MANTTTTTTISIADLITRHATTLASLTGEPLAETGADLIDQLREAEERLDRARVTGGDQLGDAAGLLDQALDIDLDGGPQVEAQAFLDRAARLLRALVEMATEYRPAS
ncbi:hypothetical protein ACF058_27535 [Streptomyces sp. NPDC015501]|uniref:hypothetical protein n=1 Tax=unclassified Streptomyces TaxID=2593676 RepID=UPI00119F9BF3|nr:hypothetical protein A3L22_28870 [Streptomyces griseus subsp. griseus]